MADVDITWENNFITEEDGVYVVWDETQSRIIGRSAHFEEALKILRAYAEMTIGPHKNTNK